jgi:hypothetical protein
VAEPFTTWSLVQSPAFSNPIAPVSDVLIAGNGAGKSLYAAFAEGPVFQSSDRGGVRVSSEKRSARVRGSRPIEQRQAPRVSITR